MILILILTSFAAYAQVDNYPIDWKYHGGDYLIYDCERSHYACVDRDGNDNCREERNFAREKKAPRYPCAPLRKFKNKKECLEEHYKIQDIGAQKRFCYPN